MSAARLRDASGHLAWSADDGPQLLTGREWLVTNGLGGFASMTLGMMLTRRYHAVLVAALPAPLGRAVMLSRLDEDLVVDGESLRLGAVVTDGMPRPSGDLRRMEFRLDKGLPVWTLHLGDHAVERRVLMPHRRNSVHVSYRLVAGPQQPARLRVRPLLHARRLEDDVSASVGVPSTGLPASDRCEVGAVDGFPALQLCMADAHFTTAASGTEHQWYALEAARGYEATGELWSPGFFEARLEPGQQVTMVASTDGWPACLEPAADDAHAAELRRRSELLAQAVPTLRTDRGAELVLAADQFLVTLPGEDGDTAVADLDRHGAPAVIAGYHWFTDWGRDTMIGLEGLALLTGRTREAAAILRRFARQVRRGLIPNLFPEGHARGLYDTADATLWYFHALHRYVRATGDRVLLQELLPVLHQIVGAHLRGTDFNIGVDPADGLLRQGEPGYQLTWMDAKVGDWVVTPRRGKAVELQGLWYNALRLMASWAAEEGDESAQRRYAEHAQTARASFNTRFWNPSLGYLYDVVDGEAGDDDSCRPNQLLAFSLEHPVLDRERWAQVLGIVTERLLTPVGLRSLAPGSPAYHAEYHGDRRSRDAAYHQGTVWPWLIGPYVDAVRRVSGAGADVGGLLAGLLASLDTACIGQLSEIADAEPPFRPRGCIAQAWSVAEVLRCLAHGGARG